MVEGGEDGRAELGSPQYHRALVALFCAGLAVFVQLYSPQGVLPEIALDFGVSAGTSSWAVGAATIGVAIGVIPWAILSDRIGRVRALRWAVLIGVPVGLALPLVPNFGVLVALRFVEGLVLSGIPAVGLTALAEMVAPRALGIAVGSYIAGNTIGGLSGRIIAGLVSDPFGWRIGLLAVSLIAASAAIAFVLLVPPTAVSPVRMPVFGALRANLRTPGVMVPVLQAFLMMGGFVSAYNYLAFRLQQSPFDLSLAQTSWIFLAYIAGAVASRWVWRLVPRLPPSGAQLLALAVMLLGIVVTLFPSLPAVIVGLVLFTGGFFGAHSVASGLAQRRANAGRSLVAPLYNLAFYAGSSLLGWAGGLAFAGAGWTGTVMMIVAVVLLAAAAAWGYAASRGGLRSADE